MRSSFFLLSFPFISKGKEGPGLAQPAASTFPDRSPNTFGAGGPSRPPRRRPSHPPACFWCFHFDLYGGNTELPLSVREHGGSGPGILVSDIGYGSRSGASYSSEQGSKCVVDHYGRAYRDSEHACRSLGSLHYSGNPRCGRHASADVFLLDITGSYGGSARRQGPSHGSRICHKGGYRG